MPGFFATKEHREYKAEKIKLFCPWFLSKPLLIGLYALCVPL
jgi:hypothetical protein